jgi:cysteine-rich repeat protein
VSAPRSVALALFALTSACVHDDLVDCGNGIVCPPELVCDVAHDSCVTPEQISSCESASELDPCLDAGVCREGVCVAVACGNALMDPGEACDDGNTASADGCSADCSSAENCGNGLVDPSNAEECDDGGLANHDGCDSQCKREQPLWTELRQVGHPSREEAAYAYDEARHRLVVFGGGVAGPTGARYPETYEWDGVLQTWLERTPVVSPSGRFGAALAYDSLRHVTVLFAGNDQGGITNDTWLWDGEHWSAVSTPVAPPPRNSHSMVYDTRRHRMIMFGGGYGFGGQMPFREDMWAWDGTAWTELHPATMPTGRIRAAMGYDPIHDEVVLAGGFDAGGNGQPTDTWIFDGTNWRQGPALPGQRYGAAMTFDPILGGLVLTGGTVNTAPATLLWKDGAWQTLPAFGRQKHVAYFDPRLGTVVAGLGVTNDVVDPTMYRLDAGTWTALAARLAPPQLSDAAISYDAVRGRVVAYGGRSAGVAQNLTYELDRTTWILVTSMTTPPAARAQAAMVYDSNRKRTVMWGGSVADDNVWDWDGARWTSTSGAIASRTNHAMAYDKQNNIVVMFGGENTTGTTFDTTYAWNGSAWQDVSGTVRPSPRAAHAMAYDEARNEIVVFGGRESDGTRPDDTWTWTLAGGWVARTTLTRPAGRVNHTMAWDPMRRRVVMFGGNLAAPSLDETWEWNGTDWSRLLLDRKPPATNVAVLAYDRIGAASILFGGVPNTGGSYTWRLQWVGPGSDDACTLAADTDGDGLAGCADADCGNRCTPLCPPLTSCESPVCGDGACDPLETCRLCPQDCSGCAPRCGDAVCDPGETCLGDCP